MIKISKVQNYTHTYAILVLIDNNSVFFFLLVDFDKNIDIYVGNNYRAIYWKQNTLPALFIIENLG